MSGFWLIGKISSSVLRSQVVRVPKLKSNIPICANLYCHKLQTFVSQPKDCIGINNYFKNAVPLKIMPKKFSTTNMLQAAHGGHDHSKLWSLERLLSVLLLPVVPAALFMPCQELDITMALLVVLHTHFGLEAVVVDYIRPILFGNVIPKISLLLLYLLSAGTLGGLLNLIYNDVGLANTILSILKH